MSGPQTQRPTGALPISGVANYPRFLGKHFPCRHLLILQQHALTPGFLLDLLRCGLAHAPLQGGDLELVPGDDALSVELVLDGVPDPFLRPSPGALAVGVADRLLDLLPLRRGDLGLPVFAVLRWHESCSLI